MHAIFDLDGTLVDSVMHVTLILNEMLGDRGSLRRLHCSETRPYISVGGERMVEALLGSECGAPAAEIADFRARYMTMATPPDCLFSGVREGLERLAVAGIPVSICSNKPQALCEKVLSDLGLADRFVAIVGGGSGRAPKPAPDLVEHVLMLLGATEDNCCFIGDGAPDFLSARAVGVKFILAGYGYSDVSEDFGGAIRCIDFDAVTAQVMDAALTRRCTWTKAAA